MRILAIDPGEYKLGWCWGESGTVPPATTVHLRSKGERIEEAAARFAKSLHAFLSEHPTDLLCIEDYLPAGAARGRTNADVREAQIILNAHIRAIAALHDIPVRAPSVQTIRRHFCGQVSGAPKRKRGYVRTAREVTEDRQATKDMVIRRAIMLGYLPHGSTDDNAADAAAVFDFASSYFGRRTGSFALMATA